jgi:hypothetical protein
VNRDDAAGLAVVPQAQAAVGVAAGPGPSGGREVTAVSLAAELAAAARVQDEQLEAMFRAAHAAGWDGSAASAYLAQLSAVTQASGVIWLLQAILKKCGPETADELACGLRDAWSGAAADFRADAGLLGGAL